MELNIKPTNKQLEAWQILLDKVTTDFLFGGGAGGGKSWLGCEWLISMCFSYPDTRYFIARKILKNLKKTTLRTFFKVCRFHGLKKDVHFTYNEQTSTITFPQTGSTIDLLEVKANPSDPDFEDLGSSEYTCGWLEEVEEIDFGAYDTLRTRIGRQRNEEYGILSKLFMTCNPTKHWPYRVFYKPFKENRLMKGFKFLQSLVDDNPKVDAGYKQNLLNTQDTNRKERLLYGNWEYDDDPSIMIRLDAINDLTTNTIDENKEKYLVVDAARFGRDSIVFSFWKGLDWYRVVHKTKQGTDITEDDIRDYAKTEQIPFSHILIDEDGIGGGIVDHLGGVKGFVANRQPLINIDAKDPDQRAGNFKNLKSQCAYLMADKINNHLCRISFKDPKALELLNADLEQYKVKDPEADRKKQIVGKDVMKEKLGRSPDFGDCFLMRMWFELKPKSIEAKEYKQKPYEPSSPFETGVNVNINNDPFDMFGENWGDNPGRP